LLAQRILPATSAVIVDEARRILVQQRADNLQWGLPGGAVEIGETVFDSLRREVREETGFEVEVIRLIGLYSDPAYHVVSYPDGNVIHYVSASFECRVIGGTAHHDAESVGQGWVNPRALPEPFVASHRPCVEDWLARQATPFLR
jgi:ADP-ribose pyrophosphatase YjhB (NUDIX family)